MRNIFRQPLLPQSPKAHFSIWIFLVVSLSVGSIGIFLVYPDLLKRVSQNSIIAITEEFIIKNVKTVSVSMLITIFSILTLCVLASIISNFIFRHKIKKEFMISPERVNEDSNTKMNKKTNTI